MKALVVIPTYNEAENIARIVPLVLAQDPELQVWILNGVAHPDPAYQGLIDKIRGI